MNAERELDELIDAEYELRLLDAERDLDIIVRMIHQVMPRASRELVNAMIRCDAPADDGARIPYRLR